MSNTGIILTSDKVLRYGFIERRIVKHCVEIQCNQVKCSQGGIGFGYEGTYIRYIASTGFPGRSSDVDVLSSNDFVIQLKNTNRVLICMDNTNQNKNYSFIVISNDSKRNHTFRFTKELEKIRLITYLPDTSDKDEVIIYTLKREFVNALPYGFTGWADRDYPIFSCFCKRSISFNFLSVFLLYQL